MGFMLCFLRFLRSFSAPEVFCHCFLPGLFVQTFLQTFRCRCFFEDFSSTSFSANIFIEDFVPEVSLQMFFFPFFFVQKFFAHGFFEAIFPVICLQIFSCFFFQDFSAAVCCKLLPEFLCGCLIPIFFIRGFFLPLIFGEFSVQMFFRRFFVHKFLCQYIHRRFRSRSFLANVFFFPFFFVQKFLCSCLLQIAAGVSLQMFACNLFSSGFFPSDLRLIFFRAVFLLVFLQRFFLRKFICMCCFFAYVFCSDVFSGRLSLPMPCLRGMMPPGSEYASAVTAHLENFSSSSGDTTPPQRLHNNPLPPPE